MKQKLKEYSNSVRDFYEKVAFTLKVAVIILAAIGTNDLSKNLHYGAQAAIADELKPIEIPERIDSKEVEIPSLDGTQLDKTKQSTHKPLEGK
jgi:hypothetical protein